MWPPRSAQVCCIPKLFKENLFHKQTCCSTEQRQQERRIYKIAECGIKTISTTFKELNFPIFMQIKHLDVPLSIFPFLPPFCTLFHLFGPATDILAASLLATKRRRKG